MCILDIRNKLSNNHKTTILGWSTGTFEDEKLFEALEGGHSANKIVMEMADQLCHWHGNKNRTSDGNRKSRC